MVDRVKPGFAADVGQTEAVAVETDSADNSWCDALGVGVIECSKTQSVHDRDRPGSHRNNVADDTPNARCGTLERFDEARVVVAFNLERDSPSLADIHHTGVLAHSHHQVLAHVLGDLLPKLAQVDLGRLVGAVLAPHNRIHGELTGSGPASEQGADLLVLILFETQGLIGLILLG